MSISLDGLSWAELTDLKRGLAADRAIERRDVYYSPRLVADVDARYATEFEAIDAAIAKHRERAEAENRWLRHGAEHPVATDLMLLLAEAQSDDDVFAIAKGIAGRFEKAAEPAPVEEPDFSDAVPDVLPTNPPRPFEPAPDRAELQRSAELQEWLRNQPTPTQEDPLAQRNPQRAQVTPRAAVRDDDVEPINRAAAERTGRSRTLQRGPKSWAAFQAKYLSNKEDQ